MFSSNFEALPSQIRDKPLAYALWKHRTTPKSEEVILVLEVIGQSLGGKELSLISIVRRGFSFSMCHNALLQIRRDGHFDNKILVPNDFLHCSSSSLMLLQNTCLEISDLVLCGHFD